MLQVRAQYAKNAKQLRGMVAEAKKSKSGRKNGATCAELQQFADRAQAMSGEKKYRVKLSNVGNPDHRQDARRPLPGTRVGWAEVATLAEASAMCRRYITHYDLGSGNWNGGHVEFDGVFVGRVSYNGRVWDSEHWTPEAKELAV